MWPSLYAQPKNLPWRQVPAIDRPRDRGSGREEHRTLKAATVAAGLCFPHAAQALRVTRRTRPLAGGKWRTITVYAITSAPPEGREGQVKARILFSSGTGFKLVVATP